MQAIILAGGQGTRLMPLTEEKPKPMIPVLNKPLMEYSIDLLKQHGINNIGVTLMYLPKIIKDYFGDGKRFDVNIKYVEETSPLGTAGSVKLAHNIIEDETFIVLSGDALTNIDITKIHKYHKSIGADVTIVLSKQENPLEYGVVLTETDGRVTSFIEKPQWENVVTNTVNTGIYIIEKHVLDKIPKNTFFDFSKGLFPMLLEEKYNVFGYITEDYWCDLGNPESYLNANIDILQGKVFGKKYENILEENVKISDNTKLIPPVYIGKNTVITGESSIGPNVVIGQNVILNNVSAKNSLLWDKTIVNECDLDGEVIGENSEIDHSEFLGKNVIGSNVKIRKNVILKSGASVFNNVSVMPESVLKGNVKNSSIKEKALFNDGVIEGVWNHNIKADELLGIASSFKDNKVFVSSNKTPLGIALTNLLASFYNLCGANVYAFTSHLNSCRFFSSVNEIQGVYIDESNEHLQIHLIDNKGLNIPASIEKKIDLNFIDYSIQRGKIIRINSVDGDFEYFLNASFPFTRENIEVYSDKPLKLHNIINKNGDFKEIGSLAKAAIIVKNNTVTDVYYENNRVTSLNYLKLKLNIAKMLNLKEIFMPPFADEEILEEAKKSDIKVLYTMQHIGNSMHQVTKFNNTALLLEYVPHFFAQALAYYLHKENISNSSNYILAKYDFNVSPEKSLEAIINLNKNKTPKSITADYKGGFITVVPRNNGYSFTAYGRFLKEEYAPDILEEFVNKNIDK